MSQAEEYLTSHHPSPTVDDVVFETCRVAEEFYKAGELHPAIKILGGFWPGPGAEPQVEGLSRGAAAELRLWCATLLGALDAQPRAQREARKGLRLASGLFFRDGDMDGVLRCEKEIALSYWREGRYGCARRVTVRALKWRAGVQSKTELAALVVLAIIECCAAQYREALSILQHAAPLAEALQDPYLLGSFYNTYGLVRKNIGLTEGTQEELQLAFIDYTAASYYLGLADNKVKAAYVGSNRGELLSLFGHFDEAHENIGRAQSLARSAGDHVKDAWFEEARARVLMAEGKYQEARRSASSAAATLEDLGAYALASEARQTERDIDERLSASRPQSSTVLPFATPLAHLPRRYTIESADDSLRNAGIEEGDQVWFDRDVLPQPGDLVAAQTPDGLVMRFYHRDGDEVTLLAAHPDVQIERYPAALVRVRGVARP